VDKELLLHIMVQLLRQARVHDSQGEWFAMPHVADVQINNNPTITLTPVNTLLEPITLVLDLHAVNEALAEERTNTMFS
jgi:hypothetical protein